MRTGYWRTLIRRLREKVDRGENVFIHRGGVFSISSVCASLDAEVGDGSDLRLARDSQGNFLLLNVDTTEVTIVYPDNQRLPVSNNLVAFIGALQSLAPSRLELGPEVDLKIDVPASRRGVLGDD